MDIEFDPAKNAANIAKRGLSFADFDDFDSVASVEIDDRYDYGETRYRARPHRRGRALYRVYPDGHHDAAHQFPPRPKKGMRRYE